MTRNSFFYVSIIFIGTIVSFGCQHRPGVLEAVAGIPGSTGRSCSTDSVYFANDILPLITSSCAMSGCHDAVTRKEAVQLTGYTTIVRYVVPGDASSGKLMESINKFDNERMPPPPNPAFTAAQIAKIKKWINQGALNNACDRCDTIDFKFSTAIGPMMQSMCQGCHNPSLASGGVDLSSYAGAHASALSGRLYGSVNWVPGYSPMPKTGIKMPDCQILQIKKWIDAGSPNN
jgi:hypothetical protein